MASMQDRMKFKRVSPVEAWSTREQLCLASSVLKSGDQNWMSVSRSLKPFVEKDALRPPDWYSQKSCAIQYSHLLENADTPKRKKRESGETTSESIVRKLTQERITELSQILNFQREEYLRLKTDMNLLKSGTITDEKLEKLWVDMQHEEREQDQKVRVPSTWIAKRPQKQESSPSIPSTAGNQRKVTENTVVEVQETPTEPSTEDDEKKNRGGRSPLLTSLLKSPSPTTQMQTTTSMPVQTNSPTITSLLGSSPKILNAQLTQNVSPQLQQLVSTAIASAANTTSERPSVGAPTLSMLLEMPAGSQRGPLPNLQTTPSGAISTTQTPQQQTITTTEVHSFPQVQQARNVHQVTVQQNAEVTNVVTMPAAPTALPITVPTTNSMPVSENMVQIIDHIDDVISRKDIISDVMDKDEINEIIGDIEELIKEEITAGSPVQTLKDTSNSITAATTAAGTVIGTLTVQTSQQATEVSTAVTEARPQPRDVDEAVSLSDSPQSEMAIEEIDSSTSNIAEIIGTVAIEPQEPKITVPKLTETVSNTPEETKSEKSVSDEKVILAEELVPELKKKDSENSKDNPRVKEEKQLVAEAKSSDIALKIETEENKQGENPDEMKETIEEIVEKKEIEKEGEKEEETKEEETEIAATSEDKDITGSAKERKESAESVEGKNNIGLDQLEIHLAKITDQRNVPSTEVVGVSSEVTNDLPSTEDTEKSQDISLILEEEDEEERSSQSSECKKKVAIEQAIENTVESTVESVEQESIILVKKEKTEIKEDSFVKSQTKEPVEETPETYTEKFKKEEEDHMKDSSEDTTSSILQDVEVKEEVISEPINKIEKTVSHVEIIEEIESGKSGPVEPVSIDTENTGTKETESVNIQVEEFKTETEAEAEVIDVPSKENLKKENEIKEEKEEKEDTKKNAEIEQKEIKKEIESGMVSAGEEPGELDEEESSLSKLSGGRAMKTYSKRQQNIAVDSETDNESTGECADYRAWKKSVMLVYNRLAAHKYASIFLRPITEDQAPGYHSVIFRPMDLSTIKKNIDNGTIRSTMHFQRDVMLMFQNAIMYNKHDTFIYKMAVSMQEECLQHMQIFVQATGEGTFRRETRTAASSSSEPSDSGIKRKRSHITPSPHDTDSPRSKKRRKSEND